MGGIQPAPNHAWVMISSPRMIMIPSQNEGMPMPAMLNARTT